MVFIRNRIRYFLRDPLAHFLLGGVLIFSLHAVVTPRSNGVDDSSIRIDRSTLVRHIQAQARFYAEYGESRAAAHFEAMTDDQRQRLIDDYVREEALYREAVSLGLGEGDYVIRRRLVQTLEYLLHSVAEAAQAPPIEEVARHYERHKERYRVPQTLTFTHVFFDVERHGVASAQRMARNALATLNSRVATFNDAPQYGDRFLYYLNYVEQNGDLISSHFGTRFYQALKALSPGTGEWVGPLRSSHGFHLVLVTQNQPAHVPELDEVLDQVRADAAKEKIELRHNELVDTIKKRYRLRLALETETPLAIMPADAGEP